jgi:hypothetical protein
VRTLERSWVTCYARVKVHLNAVKVCDLVCLTLDVVQAYVPHKAKRKPRSPSLNPKLRLSCASLGHQRRSVGMRTRLAFSYYRFTFRC